MTVLLLHLFFGGILSAADRHQDDSIDVWFSAEISEDLEEL